MRTEKRTRDHMQHDDSFVLRTQPWRETSLLIDLLTRHHGRLLMTARSARQPRSAMRGQLQAFHRLQAVWHGRKERLNLSRVEWVGRITFLPRMTLMSGYYLNELILRLLHLGDPHAALFDAYANTLERLSHTMYVDTNITGLYIEACLRRFEVQLLQEVGYGCPFNIEATSGKPVHKEQYYGFQLNYGVMVAGEKGFDQRISISGAALLEMNDWLVADQSESTNDTVAADKMTRPSGLFALSPDDDQTLIMRLAEQKRLLRTILIDLLQSFPLHSRTLIQDVFRYRQL